MLVALTVCVLRSRLPQRTSSSSLRVSVSASSAAPRAVVLGQLGEEVRHRKVGEQGATEHPHHRDVLQALGRAEVRVRAQPLPGLGVGFLPVQDFPPVPLHAVEGTDRH
jgi:hypothetical protein